MPINGKRHRKISVDIITTEDGILCDRNCQFFFYVGLCKVFGKLAIRNGYNVRHPSCRRRELKVK